MVFPDKLVAGLLEDNIDAPDLATMLFLQEASSPGMKVLKDNRVELDDKERKEVMRRKAVWHPGNKDKPVPAVWKSIVRGRTYFVCNTHRCFRVARSVKRAIKNFDYVKTTA